VELTLDISYKQLTDNISKKCPTFDFFKEKIWTLCCSHYILPFSSPELSETDHVSSRK